MESDTWFALREYLLSPPSVGAGVLSLPPTPSEALSPFPTLEYAEPIWAGGPQGFQQLGRKVPSTETQLPL